ncbi:neutral zinc metallopeptidase [Candidatus Saccharibacteria bacterium]|nr:neutral zinc metallopeptidase [Candidatus Saccharibacteria bacterium]
MALWDKISSRGNVEDRRGMSPQGLAGGIGGLGLTGVIIYLVISLLSGGSSSSNLDQLLQQLQQGGVTQQTGQPEQFAGADQYETFASAVVGSNNDLWREVFTKNSQTYDEPKLVLFRSLTNSGCGYASSQVGPHYCPTDKTVYLDETFFDELQKRFGAEGGDVAEAYVLSHEVGHHAQNELGIMEEVQRAQQADPAAANDLSIKLELQADCFAGLWAYSIKDLGVFTPGEINEAINAAEAVGDDRIQEKVQGQVNPESWTHGSSAQRVEWFNRGYESGQVATCNTFAA